MSQRRFVYLDHAASTPTDPRVVEAMMPYFGQVYGNSSSAHWAGREAERAIEDAREAIAGIFNCKPMEIVFTSGGTESDNLAIRGAAWTQRHKGCHLITTPVEHSAVGGTVKQLVAWMGYESTALPVDGYGQIDIEVFEDAIRPDTVLASVIYANNEVGTINPIPRLAEIARERGVLFHTDAVQAAGQLSLDVQALGVDMLSISAHKFYGPKGVGALFVREGIDLLPAQSGGSHEEGRRAGTLNTPGIVGMAKALELVYGELDARVAHYRRLRDRLIEGILSRVQGSYLTGHREQRSPSHASFVFDGVEGNMLLMHLDIKGVAASSASACKTGNPEPSGVLLAMGYMPELASSSLRLSVGKDTTDEDVDYAVSAVAEVVEKLRRFG
ncbi:MAG: cysteine desulfurase NifS [Phototrophicales bacterium]|nr:MAG: cysteine desulfurase NifS [Phototrophicales bacterium]